MAPSRNSKRLAIHHRDSLFNVRQGTLVKTCNRADPCLWCNGVKLNKAIAQLFSVALEHATAPLLHVWNLCRCLSGAACEQPS
jgi:hypothetical protein